MSEPINKPEDEEMDVEFNDVDDQIVPDELPEQTQKQDDQQPQQPRAKQRIQRSTLTIVQNLKMMLLHQLLILQVQLTVPHQRQ